MRWRRLLWGRVAGDAIATAVVAAIVCACAGCATPGTRVISLVPDNALRGEPDVAGAKTAGDSSTGLAEAGERVVFVDVIATGRQDAGNVFGSRMIACGFDERLADALNSTIAKGVRVEAKLCVAGAQAEQMTGAARVSFAKAYIHVVYQTKSAVVVLKLEHAGNTRYFRAQRTGLNWTSGDGEFRKALIMAFDEAVAKLRPELLKLAEDPVPVK